MFTLFNTLVYLLLLAVGLVLLGVVIYKSIAEGGDAAEHGDGLYVGCRRVAPARVRLDARHLPARGWPCGCVGCTTSG